MQQDLLLQPSGSNLPQTIPQGFGLASLNASPAACGLSQYVVQQGDHSRERGFWGGRRDQREQPSRPDRPKSKHLIPGCEPWLLVKTKLGRRFVYNPELGESFWKFPLDVMKGVVEYDRLEREKKPKAPKAEDNEFESAIATVEPVEIGASRPEPLAASIHATRYVDVAQREDGSEEYEEVEVTDDEDDQNAPKRQKTGEDGLDLPVEFNEDDIAYQLAAMGQDYGPDIGEHGEEQDGSVEEGLEAPALTEEDSTALFKDMLDDYNINPYTTWENIIEAGQIIEDERYIVLHTMKSRKEAWSDWSCEKIQRLKEQREREEKKDPRIQYFSFLQSHASPKLYWPEFRRKYKNEPPLRDPKLSDKDREKSYREYINRKAERSFSPNLPADHGLKGLKLSDSTLKSDLVKLLKSISLHTLHRSTAPNALPTILLTDLRYASLRPSVRDPLVETHIASLPPAPSNVEISPEAQTALSKQREERKRREQALVDRQKQVMEAKRKQQESLRYSKEMLKEGEEEIERAMKVGKEGLRSYIGV